MADLKSKQDILNELNRRSGNAQTSGVNKAQVLDYLQKRASGKQELPTYMVKTPNAATTPTARDAIYARYATDTTDEVTPAQYAKDRIAYGADPYLNYVQKYGEKKAQEKEQELTEYKQKYKDVSYVNAPAYADSPAAYIGNVLGQLLGNKLSTGVWSGDTKEGKLTAEKNYYENLSESAADQKTMINDLSQIANWPEEDRKELEDAYKAISFRGYTYGIATAGLAKKYGKETIDNIMESYSRYRNQQKAQEIAEGAEKFAGRDIAIANPLAVPSSAAANVAGGVGGSIAQLGGYLNHLTGSGRYNTLDPYLPGNRLSIWGQAASQAYWDKAGENVGDVTEWVTKSEKAADFTEKATKTVGAAAQSAAENLLLVIATQGHGTLALMGMRGFADASREATMRGASPTQAMLFGLASAGIEAATEKIPLDELLDAAKAGRKGIVQVLKQAGIEATEEELSYIGSLIADSVILQGNSEYDQMVQQLVAIGVPYEEAVKKANEHVWEQAKQTALQAALSGGMMSAGNSLISKGQNKNNAQQNATATQTTETKTADTVSTEAQASAEAAPAPQKAQTAAEAMRQEMYRSLGIPEADVPSAAISVPAVQAAVESYRQTGTVSNNKADAIAKNADAAAKLFAEVGMEKPATASETRAAVKQAIAQLTQKVDNTAATNYDNVTKQGGNQYAEQQAGAASAGTLSANNDFAGVQAESRGTSFEAVRQQGSYAESDEDLRTRLSGALGGELERRGYRNGNANGLHLNSGNGQAFEVLPVDASTFHDIFEVARKYTKNGELVDLHDVKTTEDGIGYEDCENYLSADGMSGFSITPDGDLISVFNAHGFKKKGFLRAIAPVVKAKVKTLDCYMSERQPLSKIYEKVFGMKVASVMEHNMDYDHDGIAANHNNPKVAFMVNTDAPVEPAYFGKDDYDAAKAHQVSLVPAAQVTNQPAATTQPSAPQQQTFKNPEAEAEYQQRLAEWEARQQATGGFGSVGAANAGFSEPSPIDPLIERYGSLPSGENPVRSDELPKSVTGKDRVSQTAVTAKGAKVTPDEFVPLLDRDVADGGFSYITITNNATTQKAMDYISYEGWQRALDKWDDAVESGKSGADLVAQGALLYNNAVNAGNHKLALDILHTYQRLGRNTAQGLQAFRILKTLAPSDKLYMVEKSIQKMVDQLGYDITLDQDLVDEFNKAETDEQRDAALNKITKSVAEQIPSTFMDKVNAVRYLFMLGNLKTQFRNVLGNLAMASLYEVKNEIAAGLELAVNKISGGKVKRTKSFTVSRAQLRSAYQDFKNVSGAIMDGLKFGDDSYSSDMFRKDVLEGKRVFKVNGAGKAAKIANAVLSVPEGYRKATNWFMEKGDIAFSKPAYARALAGYLKANGVTDTDFSKVDTKLMDDARLYAIKEAQEQTFRDNNAFADWFSRVGRRKDTWKPAKIVAEGVIPFRKTPANVLLRAEELSPLGIINSTVLTAEAALKKGDVSANDVINSWAKSITGTGLFVLGMLLSNAGHLIAGGGEDEEKNYFDKANGLQRNSFVFDDGTNFTIDFLGTGAIPLLMGATLNEIRQDEDIDAKDIATALISIADPLIEMSMLQSLQDTIDDVKYSEDPFGQLIINAALNYLQQLTTSTLGGQIERTFEDTRMETFVDKDSQVPAWLQKVIGKASAKTIGWDYQQIPYVNAWGEVEENLPTGVNAIYNLLSPAYVDKASNDSLTNELNRLRDVTGVNVYPERADSSVTFSKNGEKQTYNLSADEYVEMAKLQGKTQKDLVESIIKAKGYDSLPDEQKAKVIKEAYSYAKNYAKGELIPGHPGETTKWINDVVNAGGDLAQAMVDRIVEDQKKADQKAAKEKAKEEYWANKGK